MYTPRSFRSRALAAAIALVAVIGTVAIGGGAIAGSPPRPEASLTDATAEPAGAFVAVSPMRVLDTRPAPHGPIGVATSGRLAENDTIAVLLAGDGQAIPARATSAFLNITIDDDATLASFLTVWPTGEPRPLASANNALPGLVASNAMLAKLGDEGSISIFNQQGDVNVVIDLIGYVVPLEVSTIPATVPATMPGTVPATVPPEDPHAGLLSGTAPPSAADGSDGDFFLDTSSQILHGPKVDGAWPTPGLALGGIQSIASAHDIGRVALDVPASLAIAIPFAIAGPVAGSIARVNDTTFTLGETGLYTVHFHFGVAQGGPTVVRVAINGVPVGPATTIDGSSAANSVLIAAEADDTLELVVVGSTSSMNVELDNPSIVVEQIVDL